MSLFDDFTAPYSRVESFVYDRVIAPAVVGFHTAVLERLAEHVEAEATVCEVGCGGGQLLAKLAERFADARFVGVDLSAEQVARAKTRTARFADRIDCTRGSALDLPLADASADLVLSVASIKHWAAPERGLAECRRVLRPGGWLAIIEADRGARAEDINRFVAKWRIPGAFVGPGTVFFRNLVAGRAFDLDDARALLGPLDLDQASVERIDGLPAWLMTGCKPKHEGEACP